MLMLNSSYTASVVDADVAIPFVNELRMNEHLSGCAWTHGSASSAKGV